MNLRPLLFRWPLCVPYDKKTRICFRRKVWNHRCAYHVIKAQEKYGEMV